MKLLAVSNLYPPFVIGGYEMNCQHVVNELRIRRHDVIVATTPSHVPGPLDPDHVHRCLKLSAHMPEIRDGGVTAEQRHLATTSNYENIVALRHLLQQYSPDLVFLWNIYGLGTLHIIDFLNSHGVPWALYLGDHILLDAGEAGACSVRSIFRGHDPEWFARGAIMAVSQHLVDEVEAVANFKFPKPPTIVHGYVAEGMPAPRLCYQVGGQTRFLSAGRIGEHKGVGLICDAATLLIANGLDNFTIDLYGGGDVTHYVSQASGQGLAKHVRFRGFLPQVELLARYRDFDAFLFPTSTREPFAFAPLEAAAAGCFPILTANCGNAERLIDQVHCIKIERTAESLALAMRRIIQGEVNLSRVGAVSATMIRQDLTLSGHVDKIVLVLKAECRPWDLSSLNRDDALLLPFIKHFLSLKMLFA